MALEYNMQTFQTLNIVHKLELSITIPNNMKNVYTVHVQTTIVFGVYNVFDHSV